MSVGIGGGQGDGVFVCFYRVEQAAGFIEHVPQIEIGEGVARVDFNGFAIVRLGGGVVAPVVIQSSQVDMSGGVGGIKLQSFLVCLQRFLLRARIFFERDTAGEKVGG